MAVTKIKPVKGALKRALDYIQNPDKTDDKILVSSYGCAFETACAEFEKTLAKGIDKGNNLAHHLIQSFEPGEATAEQAHEIGKRLADEFLQGKYEYVLTTHINKAHVHNHLIFCATSFVDHKKYISNRKSYYGIRNASDRLCKEYGLSIVAPGRDKGKSYAEYQADHAADLGGNLGGGSYKGQLKAAIDTLIPQSADFADFLKRLEAAGYEVKRGKYISVRADGQERFTRTKTLGADYAEDAITRRIAEGDNRAAVHDEYDERDAQAAVVHGERHHAERDERTAAALMDAPPVDDTAAAVGEHDAQTTAAHGEHHHAEHDERTAAASAAPTAPPTLPAEVEYSLKAQQSAGLERWQKLENAREAAKTLNFLTDNGLLRYDDLTAKEREAAAAFDTAAAALNAAEKRLADMASTIKRITAYRQTKPIYDDLKTAKTKAAYAAYRKAHGRDIARHIAIAKALKPLYPSGVLPNLATLQTEYAALSARCTTLKGDYAALKRAAREYGVVKKNVDSILNPADGQRERRRERGAEL